MFLTTISINDRIFRRLVLMKKRRFLEYWVH